MLDQNQSPQARTNIGNDTSLRVDLATAQIFAIEEMLRRLTRVSTWLDNQVSPFARVAHKRTKRIR